MINNLRIFIGLDFDVAETYTFEEITELYQFSIKEFIDILLDLNPHTEVRDGRLIFLEVLKFGDTDKPEKYFVLSPNGVFHLQQYLRGDSFYTAGSDADLDEIFNNYNSNYSFRLRNELKPKRIQKIAKEGEFFNYLQKTSIDLTRCGIFNQKQHNTILDEGLETYRYDLLSDKGCLYYSLYQNLLLDDHTPYIIEDLNAVFIDIHRTSLKFSSVEHVAKELNIGINIRFNDGFKNRIVRYNEGCDYVCNIGFLADHYFLDYKTDNTLYSVVNYFDICNEKHYNYIYAKKKQSNNYQRDNTGKRFITAYDIVELFLKHKEVFLFDLPNVIERKSEEVNKQTKAIEITKEELIQSLSKIESDKQIYNYEKDLEKRIEDMENKLKKDSGLYEKWVYVSCDCETNRDENYKINGITAQYKLPNEKPKGFIGEDCILELLKAIPTNTILYFHNAKFDLAQFQKYFTEITDYVINDGGKFISQRCRFFKKHIIIIDTTNYLTGKLSDIAGGYGLLINKELIEYKIYNELISKDLRCKKWYRNIKHDLINYYNKDTEDSTTFIENIKKWNLKKINVYVDDVKSEDEEYDALGYLFQYGLTDVVILEQVFNLFKQSVMENFSIDMNYSVENGLKLYPTISSLSKEYTQKTGCLDGVCSNIGVIREFIDGVVVGGRTMLCNNERVIETSKPTTCIDYGSLYPSAIVAGEGYAVGKPTLFEDSLNGVGDNYFIAKIRVISIDIRIKYPVLSKVEKRVFMDNLDGEMKIQNTRCFTNDFKEGDIIIVDKYTLLDAVKFQGLKYEVCYGLVWLDGFNTTIIDVVKDLYQTRQYFKLNGNKAGELAVKTLMNCIYGFTAQKPHITKVSIKNSDIVLRYVLTHSKRVCIASRIGDSDKYLIKQTEDITKHSNFNHIAASILSKSKSLMNDVFYVAEKTNISMYYTDTDSIFLNDEDLPKLQTEFKKEYNRELLGKQLNTFKTEMNEFCFRNEKGEYVKSNIKNFIKNNPTFEEKGFIGGEGLYCGKKTYIVKLKHKDNDKFEGYIFSSKGFTDTSLFHHCNKMEKERHMEGNMNEFNLWDFYKYSLTNKSIIDMCEDGLKFRLEYVNTEAFQKLNFTRTFGGFDCNEEMF